MSSSGHYTRYINQYPGWSDNCDTMHRPLYHGDQKLGYFQVEHNHGNTWAYCTFFYGDDMRKKITIVDHEGKMAIQHVLNFMQNFDYNAFTEQRIKYDKVAA